MTYKMPLARATPQEDSNCVTCTYDDFGFDRDWFNAALNFLNEIKTAERIS